jgi:mono/diheme cytochrome c family protein
MTINSLPIAHPRTIALLVFLGFSAYMAYAQKPKKWEAPSTANELKNPFKDDAASVAEGKKLFLSTCSVCHGETGKGNGAASVALTPHPANFLSIEIKNESDGAIFWKLTEGNPPMASYKTLLTDEQRWKLVTFIRNLEEKDKHHEKKQ